MDHTYTNPLMRHSENNLQAPYREIDYLKVVRIVLSRWYLILMAVLTALLLAQLYLWFSPKTFSSTGVLKFEEKKPELSDLVKVMSQAARSPASLQNEKFVIHSRTILLEAIKQLDYQISFYTPGQFRNNELYPQKPLHITLLGIDQQYDPETIITFKPLNRNTFRLSWASDGQEIQRNFNYNRPINICDARFMLQYADSIQLSSTYLFRFNTPESLLERVSKGLQTSETVKNSNVINIWQRDSNPHFAADVLNATMKAYLNYDQQLKTQSATQMISFINAQLTTLYATVRDGENAIKKHKQSAGMMDSRLTTNHLLSKLTELQAQQSSLKIEKITIEQLQHQLITDKNEVKLNFNLHGLIDQLLLPLISNLNALISDQHLLLKTYTPDAAPVLEIRAQIEEVKKAVSQNISSSNQRILKNMDYLDSCRLQLSQQLAALPASERDFIALNRDFEINEKVYSFLSEKKLETQINRSAVLPGATIIEQAQRNDIPLSPDPPRVYRTAIILGLLAGVTSLILMRVLNTYIYDQETVAQATSIPIAGVVRKFPEKITTDNTHIPDLVKSRTIFAESVRAIRTYLNFLATEKKSKVIAITSEIAGEGKSFIAVNLSSSLALIDKKVILIGADLRRPKLHRAFGLLNSKGLTNYLYHQNSLDEIIQPTGHKNLDFIGSGPPPPNPAELLYSDKLTDLMTKLRDRYDIILIDTAPVGLVSDSIPLLCKSDITLFVIRYGKSKLTALPLPEGLANEYQLNNMVIVLNAFEKNQLQANYYRSGTNAGPQHYYADYKSEYESTGYYEPARKPKWWKIRK
jgi:tyrosine-protein kinase Etk/Wzc